VTTVPVINQPSVTAAYTCDGGKSIAAAFYDGAVDKAPMPGQPPMPHGSVSLTLSDGRVMTLAQTISADGARYANFDESFVFWSKGEGALVLENDTEKNFTGCVTGVGNNVGLPNLYTDNGNGFSIRYPDGYVPKSGGPDNAKLIAVKFMVPSAVASGTNLSSDSYLSVEVLPQSKMCSAADFLDGAIAHDSTQNYREYSIASSSDAGAGNRYEETVYALSHTSPCFAVHYFIHYSVFENYPVGQVKEFDKAALLAAFDSIRRSLALAQ
jgi:hypothetical protein